MNTKIGRWQVLLGIATVLVSMAGCSGGKKFDETEIRERSILCMEGVKAKDWGKVYDNGNIHFLKTTREAYIRQMAMNNYLNKHMTVQSFEVTSVSEPEENKRFGFQQVFVNVKLKGKFLWQGQYLSERDIDLIWRDTPDGWALLTISTVTASTLEKLKN